MQTGECWRLGRRPALDGLRAFAVLAVVGTHTHLVPSGGNGVDIFFALSGFLITALLLEEVERDGAVSLRSFYARRVRRLAPALLVMVTAMAALGAALGISAWFASPRDVALALLYLSDFPAASGAGIGAFGHTWSLAMEEQFYLVWPLVLLAVARFGRRALVAVATLAAVASATWSAVLAPTVSWQRIGFGLDTRSAPIFAGCALAAWLVGRSRGEARSWLAAVALVALGAACFVPSSMAGAWYTPAVAVASVVLLWALVAGECRFWLLDNAVMRWIGRRSYAVYLWHYPVAVLSDVVSPTTPSGERFALILALSLGLAELSWRFVEQPFFSRSRRAAAALPVATVAADVAT